MRSTLAWVWVALAGGVVLSACVVLARGAPHPALAALGSAFWIAVGGALCWWHARGVEKTRATPREARAPFWPLVAPVLAALLPTAGATILAVATRRPEALSLAGLLGVVAALAAALAWRGRARRSGAGLRRALLVAGLPATALGMAAPLYGLVEGFSPPVVVLAVQGLGFGAIPGLWCAGAWLLGGRAPLPRPRAPEISHPAGA